MTRWSRDPYSLVLACIGAALVVFAFGVAAVLASGHPVPPALWAVGGAAVGILVGVLLPVPGPRSRALNSAARQHAASSVPTAGGAPPAPVPAGVEPAPPPRPTLPMLMPILALVAAIGLALSGLLYARVFSPTGCQLRGVLGTPGCETQLLDFAAVLVFIATSAGGAVLGIYVPRSAPPRAPAEDARQDTPGVGGTGDGSSDPTNGGESPGTGGTTPSPIRLGLLAAIAAIAVLVLLVALVLLSLLPRATAAGARAFNIGSLVLILATIGLTVVAFTSPPEKKQRWIVSAVLTAALAFMSNTASGFVLDRVKNAPAGPPSVAVTAKNYFSASVKPASVTVDAGTDCAVYLADLDLLVDDEPHVAGHLHGRSLPLDQGARACGLKRASEVTAIAAVLAAR
jgi:hypothetical protein